jgi:hypothetical protein
MMQLYRPNWNKFIVDLMNVAMENRRGSTNTMRNIDEPAVQLAKLKDQLMGSLETR